MPTHPQCSTDSLQENLVLSSFKMPWWPWHKSESCTERMCGSHRMGLSLTLLSRPAYKGSVALPCRHKCHILSICYSEPCSLSMSSEQDVEPHKNEERHLGVGFNYMDCGISQTWVWNLALPDIELGHLPSPLWAPHLWNESNNSKLDIIHVKLTVQA